MIKRNTPQNAQNSQKINATDFEDILEEKYGERGIPKRDNYEAEALSFRLGVMLKEARKNAHLTQEELAERTGTKKLIYQELNAVRVIYRCRHFKD